MGSHGDPQERSWGYVEPYWRPLRLTARGRSLLSLLKLKLLSTRGTSYRRTVTTCRTPWVPSTMWLLFPLFSGSTERRPLPSYYRPLGALVFWRCWRRKTLSHEPAARQVYETVELSNDEVRCTSQHAAGKPAPLINYSYCTLQTFFLVRLGRNTGNGASTVQPPNQTSMRRARNYLKKYWEDVYGKTNVGTRRLKQGPQRMSGTLNRGKEESTCISSQEANSLSRRWLRRCDHYELSHEEVLLIVSSPFCTGNAGGGTDGFLSPPRLSGLVFAVCRESRRTHTGAYTPLLFSVRRCRWGTFALLFY